MNEELNEEDENQFPVQNFNPIDQGSLQSVQDLINHTLGDRLPFLWRTYAVGDEVKEDLSQEYFTIAVQREVVDKNLKLGEGVNFVNMTDELFRLLGFDADNTKLLIRDPANPSKTHNIDLNSNLTESKINKQYAKYYLFAVSEIAQKIYQRISEIPVSDQETHDSRERFASFVNLLSHKLSTAYGFDYLRDGVREVKSSIDKILDSKNQQMRDSVKAILEEKGLLPRDLLKKVRKQLVKINKAADLTALFGVTDDGVSKFMGLINLIASEYQSNKNSNEMIADLPSLALGDAQDFISKYYVKNVIELIHSVAFDSDLSKLIASRGDINQSEFIKTVSTAIAKSSVAAFKRLERNLMTLNVGNIAYAENILKNKRDMNLLNLIAKFGLQDTYLIRDPIYKEHTQIFLDEYAGKKRRAFAKAANADPIRFKRFLNKLIAEYRNRHAALFAEEGLPKSFTLNEYRNLLGVRTRWIHGLMRTLVDLISNPGSREIIAQEDKMHALTDFFIAASEVDAASERDYDQIINKMETKGEAADFDDIEQIKIFRDRAKERSVSSICGFDPAIVFNERELKSFRQTVIETELLALITVMSSDNVDASTIYKAEWQKDLFSSRLKAYKAYGDANRKELFKNKIQELEDILGGSFSIRGFVNQYSRTKFLNQFVSDLMQEKKPKNLARSIEILTLLSKINFRWNEIFSLEKGGDKAFRRFKAFIDRLTVTLKSSDKFPEKNVNNIFSQEATSEYFFEFLNKSFGMGEGVTTAPELAAVLYYLSLRSMQIPRDTDQFLNESYGYHRRVFSFFFDPQFRASIKKVSPALFEEIASLHSKQVNFYIKDLERFLMNLSARIEAARQDVNNSDLPRLQGQFENLLVNYYYHLEQAINQVTKENPSAKQKYDIVGITKLMEQILSVDPKIAIKLLRKASFETKQNRRSTEKPDTSYQKAFINALINRTNRLAKQIMSSNFVSLSANPGSLDRFIDQLDAKFKRPSDNYPVDLMASSLNIKRPVIKYLFAKLNEGMGGFGDYIQLVYNLVYDKGSLAALKGFKSLKGVGHMLIGNRLFVSPEGIKIANAIMQFYDSALTLKKLTSLDSQKISDYMKNIFSADELTGIGANLDYINQVLNLRHIFYRYPVEKLQLGQDGPSVSDIPKWEAKFSEAIKKAQSMSIDLAASFRGSNGSRWTQMNEIGSPSVPVIDKKVIYAIDDMAQNGGSRPQTLRIRSAQDQLQNAA